MEETTEQERGAEAQSVDIDVDDLIARVEAGEEINPGVERDAPTETAQAPVEAPKPAGDEFELNGQKLGRDQLLELAKRGMDFDTLQGQLTKSQSELAEREKGLGRYKEIDDFAAKNPEWWSHVTQNYEKAQAQPMPEIPEELKAHLEPILKDYKEMKSFISDYQRERVEEKNRAGDAAYRETLKGIEKTYGIEFHSKDPNGQTLEQRVLAHAQKRGISNMEAAYRDYDFDNIVKRADAAGREAVVNEQKKNQKLGLLKGAPPAPSFDFDFTPNQGTSEQRPASWNDAYEGALEDLRTLQRA